MGSYLHNELGKGNRWHYKEINLNTFWQESPPPPTNVRKIWPPLYTLQVDLEHHNNYLPEGASGTQSSFPSPIPYNPSVDCTAPELVSLVYTTIHIFTKLSMSSKATAYKSSVLLTGKPWRAYPSSRHRPGMHLCQSVHSPSRARPDF